MITKNNKYPIKRCYTLIIIPLLLLFVLLLQSCTSIKEKDNKNKSDITNEVPFAKFNSNESRQIKDDAVKSLNIPKSESISKDLIKTVQQKHKSVKEKKQEAVFYDYFLAKNKNSNSMHRVTMAYDAAPIADVVPIFSKILNFNYLIDPKVTGVVTLSINSELSQKDLWKLFQQILWLTGSYCSLDDSIVHILPFDKMSKERQLLGNVFPQANVSVVLFHIKNAKSTEILEKIRPFLTDGATAMDIANQNSILIVEAPTNISKITKLIKMLDLKNKNHWPQAVISCINIPASRAVDELASILPILGFPVSVGNSSAEPGAIDLQGIDRMQLIVASAANNQALDELKKWVALLDRTDIGDQEQVYVYNIENAKAEELVKALSVIFSIEGDTLKSSSSSNSPSLNSSSSSSANFLSAHQVGISNPNKSNNNMDIKPVSVFEVPVKIFADAVNMRLIIKTTPRAYAMIKALLMRIDTIPSQVLLQITIAEIQLTSKTDFGIQSFTQKMGTSTIGDAFKGSIPVPAEGANAGFSYALSSGNTDLTLRALATKGNVKVLARPQILVESHTEAKVSVGEEVPLLTQTITDTDSTTGTTGTGSAVRNSVEYKDTGIILIITPHITKGGLITTDIDQTISTVVKSTQAGQTAALTPTIRSRQLITTLSFPDKRTLIIGGLIQDKLSDTVNTIPFIGNIPFLDRLLGASNIQKERTELLLMITGTIITKETKLEEMVEAYKRSLEYIQTWDDEDQVHDNIILDDQNINNILVK